MRSPAALSGFLFEQRAHRGHCRIIFDVRTVIRLFGTSQVIDTLQNHAVELEMHGNMSGVKLKLSAAIGVSYHWAFDTSKLGDTLNLGLSRRTLDVERRQTTLHSRNEPSPPPLPTKAFPHNHLETLEGLPHTARLEMTNRSRRKFNLDYNYVADG